MAKKDKSAKAPTPDEVEAIFSDVDETGHTNASKARKERTRRRARKAAVEVDPLSGDDPSGSNVGKTMTRAAIAVLIVLLVAVVVSQVACGLVRRAGTAQLAEHVDSASVNTALRNGVEWGDGFTQFPEDYTVLEANEESGTIEVSVVDTASKNELECLAGSQIQAAALSVNALLNPNINQVIYHVDVHIDGSFEAAIHEGVRHGYTDGYLRKSIVADPLRRGNTGDNTPAAITVHLVDGDGCTITVAPKGFGSENMSRIQMLKPADGVEGFKKFVIETVKLAGSNPCPPIVLGIGVGGSFDKVAYLAKKALLRPLDVPNPDPYYADLERELLAAINELGIGPQGFGGKTTCLGLAIEQMPTHVAGLPVAVNVSCHVTRRASAML